MFEIYQVVNGGHPPRKADASAFGTLPTSAYRYCEPVRTASQFGVYMFLPVRLSLAFEDENIYWSLDNFNNKYFLSDAIQYPNFSSDFGKYAPSDIREYSPPFLTRTSDADILQIWTGAFAKTSTGMSSWVRSPVNLRQHPAFEVIEGVVETDWWFGPLFANIRLKKEGVPFTISENQPFLQMLPFSREVNAMHNRENLSIHDGLDAMNDQNWADYTKTIPYRIKNGKKIGDYATTSRKKNL